MKTPGVKNALEDMNEKQRRSVRAKKLAPKLMYDTHHCGYMANIVHDVEPTCFDDAIGDVKWEKVIDEEMQP